MIKVYSNLSRPTIIYKLIHNYGPATKMICRHLKTYMSSISHQIIMKETSITKQQIIQIYCIHQYICQKIEEQILGKQCSLIVYLKQLHDQSIKIIKIIDEYGNYNEINIQQLIMSKENKYRKCWEQKQNAINYGNKYQYQDNINYYLENISCNQYYPSQNQQQIRPGLVSCLQCHKQLCQDNGVHETGQNYVILKFIQNNISLLLLHIARNSTALLNQGGGILYISEQQQKIIGIRKSRQKLESNYLKQIQQCFKWIIPAYFEYKIDILRVSENKYYEYTAKQPNIHIIRIVVKPTSNKTTLFFLKNSIKNHHSVYTFCLRSLKHNNKHIKCLPKQKLYKFAQKIFGITHPDYQGYENLYDSKLNHSSCVKVMSHKKIMLLRKYQKQCIDIPDRYYNYTNLTYIIIKNQTDKNNTNKNTAQKIAQKLQNKFNENIKILPETYYSQQQLTRIMLIAHNVSTDLIRTSIVSSFLLGQIQVKQSSNIIRMNNRNEIFENQFNLQFRYELYAVRMNSMSQTYHYYFPTIKQSTFAYQYLIHNKIDFDAVIEKDERLSVLKNTNNQYQVKSNDEI